jgi:adenylate cyclase
MGPPVVERKLAAILSADVEGYSRLMGQDEVATVRTLTAYRETMVNFIQRWRGRVVDSPGDNLLAEFTSVVDAVECAVEIQRELTARNLELPPSRQMQFRIGVNLGDVIVDGDRIYGDGVNIAARVQGLADGGGICLSGTAYEHVETKLPLTWEFLGEQAVKNIAKPVSVYRLRLEARARPVAVDSPRRRWWSRWHQAAVTLVVVALLAVAGGAVAWRLYMAPTASRGLELPDRPSIAVLPFANLSGDSDQEYFSDGMTEDLITGLSKISGLFVIARNSVIAYKGKAVRPEQVSRDLGVRYVMEGSVRKAGNRVRITAQFIDATTGYHLWAERYDRDLKDIFAVQDEVTQKIVRALAVKLTDQEQDQLGHPRAANIEAYDDVLRGYQHLRRTVPEGNAEASRLFATALELDPEYGKAYAALGWAKLQPWQLQWSEEPAVLDRALELAQKAIAKDDSCVDAYRLLSQVHLWKKQHDRAIAEAERAVKLDPNGADSYDTLAEVLAWAGRAEESASFIKKAMRLDPHHPFYFVWTLGHVYYLTGRSDEAMATFRRALDQNPNFVAAHAFLAVLLSEAGREAEARAEGAESLRLSPHASLAGLRERLPYKHEADLDRFLAGIRKAGLQ